MKLFISGDQEWDFIWESLEELDSLYSITEICGSAVAPCMSHVMQWAEERNLPISLHMPHGYSKLDIIKLNTYILDVEEPDIVFIYEEENELKLSILSDAQREFSSVSLLLWKDT